MMTADWVLRRARPEDADALSACLAAAYAGSAARIPDLPPVWEDCAEDIAQNQVWVAVSGGRVGGGLVLIPQDDFMLVANLAAHPSQQGTGLGKALMDHAETQAVDQGFRELRLTTHREMAETQRFYDRLGWTKTGEQGNKVFFAKQL